MHEYSPAEKRFKDAVQKLVEEGIYPSASKIKVELTGYSGMGLNGRESIWRREICKFIGFRLKGKNLE